MELQSAMGTAQQAFKNILKSVTDDMQMCIQNCTLCAQTCEQVIQHCLSKGGMHAEQAHIRLLQDCMDSCLMSAKFMVRGSEFHSQFCGTCAQVCHACARDCERMSDDEMMKMCADVCRRCAESCQKMAAAH